MEERGRKGGVEGSIFDPLGLDWHAFPPKMDRQIDKQPELRQEGTDI